MIFRGETDPFAQQIQTANQRMELLYNQTQEFPWQQPQLMVECLEELRVMLEELHLAEAELRFRQEELLQARRIAEQERRRYRDLFEFAPDGYLTTGLDSKIEEANQAAANLLNAPRQQLMGELLMSFVPLQQRPTFRSMLNQLPTIGRLQEWEIELTGRSQRVFNAAVTVEVVRNEPGYPTGLRWLLRDITSRKQAEEQMRQVQLQNVRLLETDRLKTEFMGVISHELRTPMHAILGFSEIVQRRLRQQHEALPLVGLVERIACNGKHLLGLIEDILDFSRLQNHRMALHLETFDLVSLALDTVNEVWPLAEQKALELRFYPAQSHLLVRNDQTRLRQVLMNLLSNAIKFTDSGWVSLEIQELSPQQIAVLVRDTGIGISRENQAHIFKEFWQANQTAARRHGGAGLGLAITGSLVNLMQGHIGVESQPEQGTTFRVELPRLVGEGNPDRL